MSDPAWVPEARDVPAELDDKFDPARYEQVTWSTVQDKLDHASLAVLREIMRGGIGEPDDRL